MKKSKKKKPVSKREKKLLIVTSVVMGIMLLPLWTICIANLYNGNLFGHRNHYGQPVGTLLLLTVLIICTPLLVLVLWKAFKGELPKGW